MSNIKISPDLFLEAIELNRFKKFLDQDGFRKNILDNTVKFGLIKNSNDPAFLNGLVERDLDNSLGQKTVRVKPVMGIDASGNFIFSDTDVTGIPIPSDSNWYWLKLKYAVSNIEAGIFNLSANGDLIDTSGDSKLTEILRGMPNFPARIKLSNSVYNTLEYDVLEVISDSHVIIQHPGLDSNNLTQFEPETNLKLKVVGTFTQGIAIPEINKYPFNYDYSQIQLVQEAFLNTPPTFVPGYEFYLARVQVASGDVVIQDKRLDYWETKGSNINLEIDRSTNPLAGIDSVQFNNQYSPNDRNVVKVSWGLKSDNWSINSSLNIVTFNSASGGVYKSVNDFVNGDFVGGRLYFPNGKYTKIVSSVKQGGGINFGVDMLDVNNVSTNGGSTFISGSILAVPDCEEVEVLFTPNTADNQPNFAESFVFPVNELPGRCDVLVYKDPSVLYNVKYRYKSLKEYSEYKTLATDPVGYLVESSFDDNGNLKPSDERVLYPYTPHPTDGYIHLNLSPFAIFNFRNKVDKGDIIGVNNVLNLADNTTVNLVVGTDKHYQYVSGNLSLLNDVYFSLSKVGAKDGNEFRIHFNCQSVSLFDKFIYIVEDFGGSGFNILKKIQIADVYAMLNQDGGILFTMKFDGSKWNIYQNYDTGIPKQVITLSGVINDLFDPTGLGMVKGLFGYGLMDGRNGLPNVTERFLVAANPSNSDYAIGTLGGEKEHTLTDEEINHNHTITSSDNNDTAGSGAVPANNPSDTEPGGSTNYLVPNKTDRDAFKLVPAFYAVIMAQKIY